MMILRPVTMMITVKRGGEAKVERTRSIDPLPPRQHHRRLAGRTPVRRGRCVESQHEKYAS